MSITDLAARSGAPAAGWAVVLGVRRPALVALADGVILVGREAVPV
ncbi:hypothetical protein [Dactylosporangium sp. NPDC050588]